jgi:hypothetical protein
MKRARGRRRGGDRQPTLCRFRDCDDDATATVGVTPLCALHQIYLLDMLDHQGVIGANAELISSVELWVSNDPVPATQPRARR